jgi:hypothetical protein
MRRLIRWISLAALAVLLLPILHEFALKHQVYNNLPESVSTFLGYVRSLGDLPHFEYVLAFVGGLTLGIWLDAILTGTDRHQSKKIRSAGRQSSSRTRSHSIGIGKGRQAKRPCIPVAARRGQLLDARLEESGDSCAVCTKGH